MSKIIDPVVVGTDGSADACRAVEWAAWEALRRERPLRVVHAVHTWMPVAPMLPPAGLETSLEDAGRVILDEAERLARNRRPRLEVATRLVFGSPGQVLGKEAETAFEVVIGHRGRGGFAGLLLGSTGLQLAGHVSGPVVVVRGDGGRVHGDVVAGIDPATECRAALEYAFEAASLRRTRLRVVYAWQPSMVSGTGYTIDLQAAEENARWATIRATAALSKRHPDVEVVEAVIRDHPVAALTVASRRADLLVVGARDRHGLGAIRLGSVGHGVIHHADCPVAVVRPVRESPGGPALANAGAGPLA